MIFADKIKEFLKETGTTRKEFAENADIPLSTLNSILNESNPNPTYFTTMKIARTANISLDEIGGITSKDMGSEEIERIKKAYERNEKEVKKTIAEYSAQIAHKEEEDEHKKEIIRRQDLRMQEQLERISYQKKAIFWLRVGLGTAIILIFALLYYILMISYTAHPSF